ncbi:MAG: hypothetical protein IPJ26_14040 [Bacteroidetes bacterium]|nr:hypothetical protein [Bacteroidota bacterium]
MEQQVRAHRPAVQEFQSLQILEGFLFGSRLIDSPYCIGTYTVGTSRTNGSYTNNDYISHVILNGANGTAINTTTGAKIDNTGLPSSLACLVFNGGPGCDFTAHPPDYELWPSVLGRTVVLTQVLPTLFKCGWYLA